MYTNWWLLGLAPSKWCWGFKPCQRQGVCVCVSVFNYLIKVMYMWFLSGQSTEVDKHLIIKRQNEEEM